MTKNKNTVVPRSSGLTRQLGLLGLIEMGLFIAILIVGFWYVWKKGALEWD